MRFTDEDISLVVGDLEKYASDLQLENIDNLAKIALFETKRKIEKEASGVGQDDLYTNLAKAIKI